MPRDRAGTFEPVIVPRHARKLGSVEQVVLSLIAKGPTTGEILPQAGGAPLCPQRSTQRRCPRTPSAGSPTPKYKRLAPQRKAREQGSVSPRSTHASSPTGRWVAYPSMTKATRAELQEAVTLWSRGARG
ncbi:transposase [Flexivirga caeni]|uniref:Mutator family transposase n=1 Tax=Flexivirga caeni TaxID=2294115 RepID=A0A3M9MCR6_9MICO|nr:hypothetical protein EFY87_09090 [Flexivirga caeni]